jgi:NFACT protein RNA binding domain
LISVGNKKDNITIIYTPWSNLRKDASMAVGQVSFHQSNAPNVRKIHVPHRDNAIVNRLNKTRTEAFPDLQALHNAELKRKQKEQRLKAEEKKRQEKKEREEREALKWQKDHAYEDLQREEGMRSNQDTQEGDWDDDFM